MRIANCPSAAAVVGACVLTLLGCPSGRTESDSGVGVDAANPLARDACSGGCAANQLCDVRERVCKDACGGCSNGTCVKVTDGVYECREEISRCGEQACQPGQAVCLAGGCSCLTAARGASDSCRSLGKWCSGSACASPGKFEQCIAGSATAQCPAGFLCEPVYGDDLAVCLKDCTKSADVCDRGELCGSFGREAGCLPQGLFKGHECIQNVALPDGGGWELGVDGGLRSIVVPVSNTCLVKNSKGVVIDEPGKGSGNCTYAVFKIWDEGFFPRRTCRPPGEAKLGDRCTIDFSEASVATQCATGLECTATTRPNEGVCMRACNANPPAGGHTPQPSCGEGEACVNTNRYTDPANNAVVGVCMQTCDAFRGPFNTCAPVGSIQTSCVPTHESGEQVASDRGSGLCIPRREHIAQAFEPCDETDPFRGAACGSGELCLALRADAQAVCTPVCDLECNPSDGGVVPARCVGQPRGHCSADKTCRKVTSAQGATVGFCL